MGINFHLINYNEDILCVTLIFVTLRPSGNKYINFSDRLQWMLSAALCHLLYRKAQGVTGSIWKPFIGSNFSQNTVREVLVMPLCTHIHQME